MEGKNVRRRLAAILAADVAGYSRLMGADEEATLRRLQAHRRELIDPKIAEHRGRIVKTTGDGMLVEFASVVEAVRCAVEMQRAMLDREAEVPEEERMRFRVGVNLGDIIIEEDDIFGDGVNVAARLEALAAPGGVCIAGAVWDQIDGKLPYVFAGIGAQTVKNIARPVRAHLLDAAAVAATPLVALQAPAAADPQGPPPGVSRAAKRAPRLSIVVLPFANLSNDPDQDYFADAITEDLTTDLSLIVNSVVIARNTAFTYKGKPVDTAQVGRDLGVRYVLEGSLRRTADRVRINVQLIDAESRAHVWADRFDADSSNLAKTQDEVVGRLARPLQLHLIEAAAREIEREKHADLDASDFVTLGWAWYYRLRTAASIQEAAQAFEMTLELVGESVDAKVGLANTLCEFIGNGWPHVVDGVSVSREQDLSRAEQLMLEAIELDGNNPRAPYTMGRVRFFQNRLLEAQIDLKKAIALDRNNPVASQIYGMTLLYLGEPEAAIPHLERRIQLEPHSTAVWFAIWWLGYAYLLMGRADDAIQCFMKARAANPRFAPNSMGLAAALGLKGDIEAAKQALAEAIQLRPDGNQSMRDMKNSSSQVHKLGNSRHAALREATFDAGLRRAGMPEE